MASKTRSNRSGSVTKYKTRNGVRWRWQATIPISELGATEESKRIGKAGYLTAAEANHELSAVLVEARQNSARFIFRNAPTFQEYSSQWLESLHLANSTISGYRKILRNHLLPRLGNVCLDRLTASMIAGLYAELRKSGRRDGLGFGQPLGENSVLKVHIVLGAILAMAKEDGFVKVNVAREKRVIKAPTSKSVRAQRTEVKTWSPAELKAFLSWSKHEQRDELFPLWDLIAFTGMRRGEAIALRWEDIDFEKQRILIRRAADPAVSKGIKQTKTYAQRSVDVDDGLISELRNWKATRLKLGSDFIKAEAYVFGTMKNELRTPNDVSKRWSRAVKAYRRECPDIPWVTLKGLRHTHATILLGAGVPAKIVQERLGHSNINTTLDIYSHVTPTMQKDAVRKLMEEFGN